MEFKYANHSDDKNEAEILIESQWNLNGNIPMELLQVLFILIESQWNLNVVSKRFFPETVQRY